MNQKFLVRAAIYIYSLIMTSLFLNSGFSGKRRKNNIRTNNKTKFLVWLFVILVVLTGLQGVFAYTPYLGSITYSNNQICVYVYTDHTVKVGMTTADGYGGSGCNLYVTGNYKDYPVQVISSSQTVCWSVSGESAGTHYAIVKVMDSSTFACKDGGLKSFTICSAGWKCKDSAHKG